MIEVERDERSFIVKSDDQNAENLALDSAVQVAAPHLAADFQSTQVDDDGWLRWRVQREDWESLIEVLEALGTEDGINPEETDAAVTEIEEALKEPV